MQPVSTIDVIKQVLTSWQVIAVTIAILLYIHLVSYVARRYHRPRSSKKIEINLFKKKKASPAVVPNNPEETVSGSNSNDELGLEEA